MTHKKRRALILGSVALFFGAAVLFSPILDPAEAKKRNKEPEEDTLILTILNNVDATVNMIKDTQAEILDKLMNGGGQPADPLCGAGTEGQRFVPDDETTPTEYCDNDTGLIWPKTPDLTTRNWNTAVSFCPGLDLGNGQTYRLPEVKELISLLDYSQIDPALPAGHPFMNIQNSFYWSATTVVDNSALAWLVRFDSGFLTGNDKAFPFFVWCVRQ